MIVTVGMAYSPMSSTDSNIRRSHFPIRHTSTDWLASNQSFTGAAFTISLQAAEIPDSTVYVVAVGIEATINSVKNKGGSYKVGAAKILEMG